MRQTQKPRIVNLLMLTVAGMINAFGITLFMTPVKLYDSGISGTSMLLEQITPSCLSLSLFLLILNIPLFLVGLKKQGGLFTFYAIYTVGIYSLFAWLITNIFPIDVSIASPLAGTDLLLCALFGGVISGIGSGLAIRYGGAMDGIEVMAVIFAKRAGVAWANDNTEVIAYAKENPGYVVGISSLGDQQSIAPAVTKGNSTLLDWINAEIESLGEENFFHADYEATLLDTYGADYEDTLVIEGGATK